MRRKRNTAIGLLITRKVIVDGGFVSNMSSSMLFNVSDGFFVGRGSISDGLCLCLSSTALFFGGKEEAGLDGRASNRTGSGDIGIFVQDGFHLTIRVDIFRIGRVFKLAKDLSATAEVKSLARIKPQ